MNAIAATRKIRIERTSEIPKARVNVTVLHALPFSSLKLVPKVESAQDAIE